MAGNLDRGSMWHRWDPHIHTPGTILADQYPAVNGWEEFLSRIEAADPPVGALGITDYYSTAAYQQAMAHKNAGRMPNVELIFPNVELRLGVGTDRGSPVNFHLLVCPDDPDHVARLHSFLSNLEFERMGERYRCTPADICRLGRVHEPAATSDARALEVGTNQFKVDLATLREAFRSSPWARANILTAVAASNVDGTAGLQADASLSSLRREIESAAQIIFSGRPGDRAFWLGQHPNMPKEELGAQHGGCKPCLHGSDAHHPARVAAPDQDRRCWLKGDLKFETLRQACIEPEIRVFVGTIPPPAASPSQVISEVRITNAEFLDSSKIPLNPGLVGIIGARGSGKTALADLIAFGAEAFSLNTNRLSFIDRARDHLTDARIDLGWEDGSASGAELNAANGFDGTGAPRVRYLSQQFVDRLCSAEGLADELLDEIQRVIFLAHATEERLGATNFSELLDLKAETARAARAHYENELRDLSVEFVAEREKAASGAPLRARLATLKAGIAKTGADRQTLVGKSGGSKERLDAYTVVAAALQARRSEYEQLERRKTSLETLAAEVALARARTFPDSLRQMRLRHQAAQLPEDLWSRFALQFSGDVESAINNEQSVVAASLSALAGQAPPHPISPNTTLIPANADLGQQTIALLSAEALRLETLIGVDKQSMRALVERI